MSETRLNRIVVVGSGISVAMVSAILSAHLKRFGIEIIAVEVESSRNQPASEACGPEFWPLCELIGIKPLELIAKAGGTFRLGSLYRTDDRRWFVPFGAYGLHATTAGFEAAVLKALRLSDAGSLEDYSLAASAALNGKFALPNQDHPELVNALKSGVILSVPPYRQALKDLCRELQVRFVDSAGLNKIERDERGRIHRVILAGGETIEGDFWIDCSGDAALLRLEEKSLPVDLPWDSVAEVSLKRPMDEMPADQYQKTPWGWLRRKSLQGAIQCELYYKNGSVDETTLKGSLPDSASEPGGELKSRHLALGASPTPWVGNCLGVGGSVVNLGELVTSELALVQAGIVTFLDHYPVSLDQPWDARHYNQQWSVHLAEALEYTLLHKVLKPGDASAGLFDADLPDRLAQKLALFTRRGRIEEPESDAVPDNQWLSMLYGMGLRPLDSPLHLEPIPTDKVLKSVNQIGKRIQDLVSGMPSHPEFINKYFNANG